MFYYPFVLRRGTGCFSTIWLVATRGVAVTRRELLQVNVPRTCDDIMSYILEQVQPTQPDMPRPRFSLYLSSQLQYGVVVVYHRQCAMFLKELQSLVGKLLKYSRPKKLDMADLGRKMMLSTDPLSLLDEIDGPLDPLFGEMEELMPSPSTLMQMEETPERRASSAELEPSPARLASPMSRHTVSPQSITIKEPEPAVIAFPEFFGQDLDDNVDVTIEALQAQHDHFLTAAEDAAEVERAREPMLGREATGTALRVDPTTSSGQDLILPSRDGSPGMPQPLADQMTPVAPPPPSSSSPMAAVLVPDMKGAPHPEETQPKKKRKRGRQLMFLDPQTQIPNEELERQIKDDLIGTRAQPLLSDDSHRLKTAQELFSQPCGFLPEELQLLWTQAATVTPLARASSEEGRAIGPDGSGAEVPRDGTEPEAPEMSVGAPVAKVKLCGVLVHFHWRYPTGRNPPNTSPQSTHSSKKACPKMAPHCRRSPNYQKTGRRNQRSLLPNHHHLLLSRTPDRRVATGVRARACDLVHLMCARVRLSRLLSSELEDKALLFHSLLPPEPDRKTVGNIFQKLLDILATGKLRAEQVEPYGDIVILPGPKYDKELLL